MPRSIVARTSLSILVLAVIMGLLFSIMASWRVRAAEHDRLMARVDELVVDGREHRQRRLFPERHDARQGNLRPV